ncbi:MAG: terminase family protein [Bryobacteraceae bacterium]
MHSRTGSVFSRLANKSTYLQGGHRGILNCTRQWGKSTVISIVAAHRALTKPGSLTLVLSPSLRQSGEFVLKAEECLEPLKIKVRRDGVNKHSLLFPNGSRIVGLPGKEKTLRGFSNVSLLIVDEASRVPDEVYYAMRPTLANSNGDLWLMSTPLGQRGFFWKEWMTGKEWKRIHVPATEWARFSADFLAEERSKGERAFRQEYLCEFLDAENAVFPKDLIDDAWEDFDELEE